MWKKNLKATFSSFISQLSSGTSPKFIGSIMAAYRETASVV